MTTEAMECSGNVHTFICFMSKNWCNFNRPCNELTFCHYHVCSVYAISIFVLCLIMFLLQELFNELLKWIVEQDQDHNSIHGPRRRNANAHYLLERLR